jgi:peptidoglycan/LPS O-acetylase OafA/YrhL
MTTGTVTSSPDEQADPPSLGGMLSLAPPMLHPALRDEAWSPAAMVVADPRRQNNFDFLRFLLAGMVLYSHCFLLCLGHNSVYIRSEPLSRLTAGKLSFGEIAVDGFFAISGFLIVQSWLRSAGFWSYLRKRVARIYPGFMVSAAFSLLIVCSTSPAGARALILPAALVRYVGSTLALHVIALPGAFAHNPSPGVNGPTWTILPEFVCYLLVALLGLSRAYRRPVIVLVTAFVFVGLFQVQRALNPSVMDVKAPTSWLPVFYKGEWPRLLSFFLLGMCFHFYRERIRFRRHVVLPAMFLLAGAAFLRHGILLVLPVCGVYLLFAAALTPMGRLDRFGQYGDLSYGIYLYSYPVQQALVAWWRPHLTPYPLFFLAFPITCLLAFASWHWVEKPFLQKVHQNVHDRYRLPA